MKTEKRKTMKGVILAGGKATRLYPLTLVTNKHLLPVYNKPMIYYAIEKLAGSGVDRIMVVTSPHHLEGFVNLLGSGQDFISKRTGKQIQIVYGIQNAPTGLASALWIARDYIGADNCILHLGDNIFEDDIKAHVEDFNDGAKIFLKEVKDPERFGVATIAKNGEVLEVIEKPKKPKSNFAVTGLYMFDNSVFEKMQGQKPSPRGEYEITFLLNKYANMGTLKAAHLKKKYFDVGTFDSLQGASSYMMNKIAKK